MKNTALKSIRQTAFLCATNKCGLVVISPGSRNAPLTIAFNRQEGLRCISVTDERAAAFYALGAAQKTKATSVLICTSGSAVLNYAPAIAEAYFQEIPLLILTADRPSHMIGQGHGQTIFQQDVFGKHVKASFQIPDDAESLDGLNHCNRIINKALNLCNNGVPGPVHVNIPLAEPLYEQLDVKEESFELIESADILSDINEEEWEYLSDEWKKYDRKMIIVGQQRPNNELNALLNELSGDGKAIVLTETTSNVKEAHCFTNTDRFMVCLENDEFLSSLYKPDLLISIGGAIVSKKIKAFLSQNKPKAHWYLGINNRKPDVFKSLSRCLDVEPQKALRVFKSLRPEVGAIRYVQAWKNLDVILNEAQLEFEKDLEFCDYSVIKSLMLALPPDSDLHIGNSSPVRYSNLFKLNKDVVVYCNRGTSGIDGVSSTAIGAALMSKKTTTLITGEIAFLYDSNAFWFNNIPSNIRLIVINNGGGGIFRIIPGPDKLEELEEFFETKHKRGLEYFAKAYRLNYVCVNDHNELNNALTYFFNEETGPSVIEIKTNGELSADIQRTYFKKIKESYEQSDKLAKA